jgi:hypothetical protein
MGIIAQTVFREEIAWEYLKVAKIDQSPQNKGLSHTSKA